MACAEGFLWFVLRAFMVCAEGSLWFVLRVLYGLF